jgi:DNA-binding transcriptional MerR regulator
VDAGPAEELADRGTVEQPGVTSAGEVQLQIGLVAERTELSIRTIRHYDEVGLVTPSARSSGRYRLYTEDDVDRLRTIRRMKPLGFTLEEMRQLLDSLAVLADPTTAPEDREAAGAFVSDCHRRTVEALVTLEKHLAYAVEFRDLLADRTES